MPKSVFVLAIGCCVMAFGCDADSRVVSPENAEVSLEASRSMNEDNASSSKEQDRTSTTMADCQGSSIKLAAVDGLAKGMEEGDVSSEVQSRPGFCRWDCWPCHNNADCTGHGSVCYPDACP